MSSAQPHGEQHPLAAFKPRAVVDWVILRFTTPRPTQYQHLRNRMPPEWRTHAKPIGKNANSCSEWLLTIQDPPSAAAIARVLRGQGVDPRAVGVQAIEVAIDLFPRSEEARADLARAAHHLFRHLAQPPAGTPIITEPDHYRAAARPHDTLRALSDGLTVNLGAKDADHCARFYVKRHDSSQAGAHHHLPEALHRARMEVTLSDKAVPIKTLADLASFKFETLAKHLHQRKTTTPKTQTGALYRQEVQKWGRADDTKKRAAHRRQHRRDTEADSTANEWIYNALRGLTRARKNAEIPAFFTPVDDSPTEGDGTKSARSPKYLNGNQSTHSPADPGPTPGTPCTPYPERPDRGSPWWTSTPRFHRTYKHFEAGMGFQREQISHRAETQHHRMAKRSRSRHRQALHARARRLTAQPNLSLAPGKIQTTFLRTETMSFLLAMTMLSANMDAPQGSPMPITVDKHVREVYADQELCLAHQQRHMLTMRPGHIWSGQTPLPDGTYSTCGPTPPGFKLKRSK